MPADPTDTSASATDGLDANDPQLAPQARGVDREMLDKAIGGWRGLIDTGLPVMIFAMVYPFTDRNLRLATVSALTAAAAVAVWRLVRRQPLSQIASGFLGVLISAYLASRTGRAEDFFLIGILTNLGYGVAFLISILVGWPLLGVVVGALRGDLTGWRKDPRSRTVFRTASWLWVALFLGRLAVTGPLYLAGQVEALGVAKILLSWPPFLLVVYLSYRLIHPLLESDPEDVPGPSAELGEAG
ncbi:MAG: DUF3159 domain-containing protein [Candidatus Nanopelagicales bacterium]